MRQFLTERHLDALLSMYSERDFPNNTRKAVRLRIIHGHTYDLAESSSANIYNGVKKLKVAHDVA